MSILNTINGSNETIMKSLLVCIIISALIVLTYSMMLFRMAYNRGQHDGAISQAIIIDNEIVRAFDLFVVMRCSDGQVLYASNLDTGVSISSHCFNK